LIVRGRGGVVARCWGEGTTKLNGQDFSVSWMCPGDRLGVGPIELELLDAPVARQTLNPSVPPTAIRQESVARPAATESVAPPDELTKSRQLLDQLLEERQELLERLRSLELELQQVNGDCEHLRAVVDELRDELAGLIKMRNEWQHERDELQRQVEAAKTRLEELHTAPCAERMRECAPEESSEGLDYSFAGVEEHNESLDDQDALDIKAVLARYGVVIKEDEDEPFVARDSNAGATKSAAENPIWMSREVQQSGVSAGKPTSPDASPANPPAKEVKRRSTAIPRINLSALRDVANLTARVDIDRAARRQGLKEAGFKWSMGLSAIAIGWFITVILAHDPVLAHVLSFACWAIAVWWLFLGSLFYHRAVLRRPKPHTNPAPDSEKPKGPVRATGAGAGQVKSKDGADAPNDATA
jgi:hypothetical protein